MDTQALLDVGVTLVRDHWQKIAVAAFSLLFGAWWGKRRARRAWAKKEFFDRVNFSLNTLDDGTLRIRTLIEKNGDEVFLNSVAVDKVMAAALRTTAKNPVLPLAKDDRWYLLNAVLNELSEKFAQGWLQRDMGLPTRSAVYLICLTSECAGELKTRKIRAMVVQKDLLQNLPADLPQFERPHHNTRWQTLQQMSALYATEPDHFLEVELALPVTNTIVRPSTPTPMPRGPSDRITVRT